MISEPGLDVCFESFVEDVQMFAMDNIDVI